MKALRIRKILPRICGGLFFAFFLSSSFAKAAEPFEACQTESIMATAWTICLFDKDKSKDELKTAINEGMDEVRRIDRWMSEWKPDSLISKINDNAGIQPVSLTDEAWEA